jgi:membrane associated rhomboid family serine protease
MDEFWRAPPVSRTLTAATFIQSLLFYGELISGRYLFFVPRKIFFHLPPQVWRLATCFFLTGPRFDFLWDLYNLWRYSSALESQSGRFSKPGDFFIFILFVNTVIMVSDLLARWPATVEFFLLFCLAFITLSPRIICPPSHLLAEAVPGSEEEYPCIPCSTSFAKSKMVLHAVWDWWDYL